MPAVRFLKPNMKEFNVSSGAILMDALLDHDIPVASSCGGDAVCSKCKIQIIKGAENLSPESKLEIDLRQSNNIANNYRISCQTKIQGDIIVDTSYW